VRHAQYLDELADAIRPYRGPLPLFVRRRDAQASVPSILVGWTGSRLDRSSGWRHTYRVEILAGAIDVAFDKIVAEISDAVADWKPNTSAARPEPPSATWSTSITGEATYPTVVIDTAVLEPRN
jgi:hypothetical protein